MGGDLAASKEYLNRTRWFTYLVLGVTVVLSVFPLYWMFVVGSNDTASTWER